MRKITILDRVLGLLMILRLVDQNGRLVVSTIMLGVGVSVLYWSLHEGVGGLDGSAAVVFLGALAARAVEHFLVIREQSVARQVEERFKGLVEGFDTNFKHLGTRLERIESDISHAKVQGAYARTVPKKN